MIVLGLTITRLTAENVFSACRKTITALSLNLFIRAIYFHDFRENELHAKVNRFGKWICRIYQMTANKTPTTRRYLAMDELEN